MFNQPSFERKAAPGEIPNGPPAAMSVCRAVAAAAMVAGVLMVAVPKAFALPRLAYVATWSQLQNAFDAGTMSIVLEANITAPSGASLVMPAGAYTGLDLNSYALIIADPPGAGAAIQDTGANLTIADPTGNGVLQASGGTSATPWDFGGAGIGGAGSDAGNSFAGSLTITGGTILANGGWGAAGIGAGYSYWGGGGGPVTITGGTVEAEGRNGGAGIGGGTGLDAGSGGTVTISGGTVNAGGTDSGAGIGGGAGGSGGSGGNVTITGGQVTATGGADNLSTNPAATGGLSGGAGIGAGAGYLYEGTAGSLSVSGGTVSAVGGFRSAGIGGSFCVSFVPGIGGGVAPGGPGASVTVTGGSVTAAASSGGAGIGGGYGGNIGGPGGSLTVNGGSVTAVSSGGGAGFGGGLGGLGGYGAGGDGGTLSVSGGSLTATTGGGGAAIGGGLGYGANDQIAGGPGASVTVSGGTVTASATGGGAGIGGANGGVSGTVTIDAGTVTATSQAGSGGSAIGSGANPSSAEISLTNGGDLTLAGEEQVAPASNFTNTASGMIHLDASLAGGGTVVNDGTILVGANVAVNDPVADHDFPIRYHTGAAGGTTPSQTVYAASFSAALQHLPIPAPGYEWSNTPTGAAQVTDSTDLPAMFGQSAAGATPVDLYEAGALVTFDDGGGSPVAPETVLYGAAAVQPASPTWTGYTFDGWYTAASGGSPYDFSTPVTAPLTIYAQWTALQPVAVSFDSQGGSAVASESVAYGTAAAAPAPPTRAGYTFDGWYTAASGGSAYDFSAPVTEPLTLYAQWTPESETVIFDSQGGGAVASESVAYGTTAAAPAPPTRAGYSFDGWYTARSGGSPYDFSAPVTAPLTLYAQWTPDPETVTFDSQGGSAVASETVPYGTAVSAPTPPSQAGYTFNGWYTASTGGARYDFSAPVVGPLALFAQWAGATVNPSTVVQGGRTSITGTGFQPGEMVAAELHSTPLGLGTYTAGPTGSVSFTAVLPAGFATGTHLVVLTGETSGKYAVAALAVTAAAATTTTTTMATTSTTTTGGNHATSSQTTTPPASTGSTPPGASTTGSASSARALPITGIDVGRLLLAAAAALVSGASLTLASRLRRRRDQPTSTTRPQVSSSVRPG